jgi:hypothetical protein
LEVAEAPVERNAPIGISRKRDGGDFSRYVGKALEVDREVLEVARDSCPQDRFAALANRFRAPKLDEPFQSRRQ